MDLEKGFSVLLSVYAQEKPEYLSSALYSIWDGQALKPSQIVLVKDGPLSRQLSEVIDKWKDRLGSVMCVEELKKNFGLATALNRGLKLCKFDLIARMDTDDIALPCRFEKQYRFLINNQKIAVCGGQVEEWSGNMLSLVSRKKLPVAHDEILKFAKFRSPVNHPAVMFRKLAVQSVGGYPLIYPEDYPLWAKLLAEGYWFANLPDVVLRMRVGDDFLRRRGLRFLKGEIRVYRYLYKINFIGYWRMLVNCFCRAVVRLSPVFLKKFLYQYFR